MGTILSAIAVTAFVSLAFFIFLFIIATYIDDNSIVDIGWGIGFVINAWISYLLFSSGEIRQLIITILVSIWGLRLATHIFSRNKGKPEDFRYAAWRKEWKWFYLRSFLQVFMLQWILMQVISTPFVVVNSTHSPSLQLIDLLGIGIWLLGFFFEAVGDWQLTQFKKKSSSKGKLMTEGLWAWTRHPNYFGEATLWWGIFLLAYSQTGLIWPIISPLLIDYLLLFVSGIPMLEEKYKGREDWEKYAEKTSAFFPLPPKN